MKLIDLLVQELPKRGGWPDGPFQHLNDFLKRNKLTFFVNHHYSYFEDWDGNQVTREQYEAAIAAAQQPVWNGEGLPPVGCECEVLISKEWQKCEILVHTRFGAIDCAVFKTESILDCYPEGHFRTIRSEREEAINQIADLIGRGTFYSDAASVYDAIARGDIPGIKLSD